MNIKAKIPKFMKKIDDKYKLLAGRLSGEYSEEEQKKWHAAQEQHHELNQHRKIALRGRLVGSVICI